MVETAMEFTRILFRREDGVAKITLNRPEVLNALDMQMLVELAAACHEIEQDDSVRAVVITGAGRAFAAGGDLNLDPSDRVGFERLIRQCHAVFNRIENLPKPVIAAVNGLALAGGLELALVCDLIVAAEDAKFGDQHANFGLIPGGGSSIRLPRIIGAKRAKELLFTGKWLSAAEAKEFGMVNVVAPKGGLEDAVKRITDDLVEKKSPLGLKLTKMLVNSGAQTDIARGLEMEVQANLQYSLSEDHAEGVASFREKRRPSFKGR